MSACPACGGSGRIGPFWPGGMSTVCGNCDSNSRPSGLRREAAQGAARQSGGEAASPETQALDHLAYPMGRPEQPSAEDVAEAEKFVDEEFADTLPQWLANNRDDLIRSTARMFQFKRQSAEHDRAMEAALARVDESLERSRQRLGAPARSAAGTALSSALPIEPPAASRPCGLQSAGAGELQ